MLRLYGPLARAWRDRFNFDSPARRAARAAVDHLRPAVVVVGGSRGIGFSIARAFAAHGNHLLLVARDPIGLADAAAALKARNGGTCDALALDVTRSDAGPAIDAALSAQGFYLDTLVVSAGMGLSGPFIDHTAADIDRLLSLNVAALAQLVRHVLPAMVARGRGGVITLASLGGYVPGPHQAAYYASKSFVLSLSEALANETSGRGVQICTIAPGPVDTTFHANMNAQGALYRMALPELTADDVGRAAYRGFINGQRVVIPGVHYRFVFLLLRLLPHALTVPLTALLLKNPRRPRE